MSMRAMELAVKQTLRLLVFSLFVALSCGAQQPDGQVSPVKVEKFTVSKVEVSLNYYEQRLIPLDSQIKETTRSAFAEMTKLFGGLPKDISGDYYKQFQVNLRYGPAEAESDPNIINLQFSEELERQPVFGYITWKLALIHEMFHFWNAETFRYRSGKEQWFNEGVTEYYTFRLAIKLGLLDKTLIPARLGLPLGYYLSDSGTGTLPMSEAGVGEAKFKHYFLVYGGGLTAGMVLDFDIRSTTNGAKSLDDLMRALYLKFNRTDRTYTNAAIIAELNKLTGKSYAQFFAQYIQGAEIIPVGQYFNIADLYFINNPKRFDAKSQKGMILKEMFFLDQK